MAKTERMTQLVREDVIESVAGQSRAADAVLHHQVGFDDREVLLTVRRMRGTAEPGAADGQRGAAGRRERAGDLICRIVELDRVHAVRGAAVAAGARDCRRTAVAVD